MLARRSALRRVPSACCDLCRLRIPGEGLAASDGRLFRGAIFGRDSLEVAEHLLEWEPALAAEVIVTLARHQGREEAPDGPRSNEESPGRILHEMRRRARSRGAALLIYERLVQQWGERDRTMLYYGSVDATPSFVHLIGRWCDRHGPDLLDAAVLPETTVADAALAAVRWMVREIDGSDLGLLGFRRRNPRGLVHQTWKDSQTSLLHSDGTVANHGTPIATIDVQARAFDALIAAVRHMGSRRPAEARRWLATARRLRAATLRVMWMPEHAYFAQGVDRDPRSGQVRRLDSLASDAAAVLDSALLDGLSPSRRRRMVRGIVARICGPDFLTDCGVRCRARSQDHLIGFADYHGSRAVWPKETVDIARGLRRQGYPLLAEQLEVRVINAVAVQGSDCEFFYVDHAGRMLRSHGRGASIVDICGTNVPEPTQAWTVSAVIAAKRLRGRRGGEGAWRADAAFEDSVLQGMPMLRPIRRFDEAARVRRRLPRARVDRAAGLRAERAAVVRSGRLVA